MKWFVVLAVASLARFSEGGALKCLPGSDSDRCKEDSDEAIPAPEEVTTTGKECAAGTFWSSQCNQCGCSPKGYAFCTERACADPSSGPMFRCSPNSQWRDDCNTCRCTSDGQPACTDTLCKAEDITAEKDFASSAERKINEAVDLETQSYQKRYFIAPAPIPNEQHDAVDKTDTNVSEQERHLEHFEKYNGNNAIFSENNQGFHQYTQNAENVNFESTELKEYLQNFEDFKNVLPLMEQNLQDLNEEEDLSKIIVNEETEVYPQDHKPINEASHFNEKIELGEEQYFHVNAKGNKKHEYAEGNIYKREDKHGIETTNDTKHFKDNVLSHSQSDQSVTKTVKTEDFHKDILEQDSLDHKDGNREAYNIQDIMKQDFNKKPLVKRSVCKANQQFQSDCNTCKCSSDGLSYTCTHNECMGGERGDTNKEVEVFMENEGTDHIERHSVCKPTATFYIGCNTCHCNYFGSDYSCTNKPCPLPEDVELFHELKAGNKSSTNNTQRIVCVANRMFIMDCNTCWCNEDGTSFFCTRKVCAIGFPEEDDKKQLKPLEITKTSKNNTQKIVCVANRMFIMDCNTCWCNEDGTSFFCTRKVCVPESPEEENSNQNMEVLRIIKKTCRPDEVFEIDCNMCRCNPDGLSFSCTRRACLSQTDEEEIKKNSQIRRTRGVTQEPPKACLPGQPFRMDCNTCLCDNEGQDFSCTRNDCSAVNGNKASERTKREALAEEVAMACSAGSVFDKDCNVCRCTDGQHAMCTTKPCISKEAKEGEVTPLPANPDFRCNPGEQFRRGCNDCSCSADGKSVFCTVRFCDQDITPPTSA